MTSITGDRFRAISAKRATVDVFGLTDVGKKRKENADHFLIASLHKLTRVEQTSLPSGYLDELASDARGYLFLVADGVGGASRGGKAGEMALHAIVQYVTQTMSLYTRLEPELEPKLIAQLRRSVERSHKVVRAEAAADFDRQGMSTTLTMVTVVWPFAFLVHVGDSRCYRLRGGKLQLMTKDQTMAQALFDAGAMSQADAERSHLRHVLTSAIGHTDAELVTLTTDCELEDVMLLCTDGLNKHVTDDEIGQRLRAPRSAEEMCRGLVSLALERGGSDNITVVVGRVNPQG